LYNYLLLGVLQVGLLEVATPKKVIDDIFPED
jgi:hypothetical protein